MRWTLFLVVLLVFLVIDASLGSVLSLGGVVPRLVPILVVFVALLAPRMTVLWAAWGAGLLVDVMTDLPHGPDAVGPLLGPHAIGYTFGAYAVLQARPILLRRHVLTLVTMTFAFVVASSLLVVFVYAAHGWYEQETLFWAERRPVGEILRRGAGALYTTALALLLGPVLLASAPGWGFRGTAYGAGGRR